MTDQPSFAHTGYSVVPELVPAGLADFCASTAVANHDLPGYYTPEPAFKAWGRYADTMGELLLARVQPRVEAVTGYALFPTYSYLRMYCRGATLPAHTDRPSCEISVTVSLGGHASVPWPICLESGGHRREVALAPGDGMIYQGAVLPHWRERFEGKLWVQVFLHFVRRDGEFANCRFDGRERLGPIDPAHDVRRKGLKRRFNGDDPCPCGSGRLYRDCHGHERPS